MTGLLLVLLVVVIMMMFKKKNSGAKILKRDEDYVETYMNVLDKKENAENSLNKYLEKETNPDLINKAKIVKLYLEMENDINPIELVKEIDFGSIISRENISIEEAITSNSDLFIWLNMDLAIARSKQMIEVIEELYQKVSAYEKELSNIVEYNIFKATYECVLDKEGEGVAFLSKLLLGEYGDYLYDKQLIGVYKKMAASLLEYLCKDLEEGYESMLNEFAHTKVGTHFMKDLDIIDIYIPQGDEDEDEEEEIEEAEEIENSEE